MNIMLCGLCGDYFWIYKLICRKSPAQKKEKEILVHMYFIARTTLMQQYQRQIPPNPCMTKKVLAKNYCQCAEYRKKVANCICIHGEFSFYPREFSLLFNRTWTNREQLNIFTIYITNGFSFFLFLLAFLHYELNWLWGYR